MAYTVYLLQSEPNPTQKYVGVTQNLKKRIEDHNAEKSTHTSKYAPWKCVVSIEFHDKYKAYEFEKYLKSHSGRAFASKRFL